MTESDGSLSSQSPALLAYLTIIWRGVLRITGLRWETAMMDAVSKNIVQNWRRGTRVNISWWHDYMMALAWWQYLTVWWQGCQNQLYFTSTERMIDFFVIRVAIMTMATIVHLHPEPSSWTQLPSWEFLNTLIVWSSCRPHQHHHQQQHCHHNFNRSLPNPSDELSNGRPNHPETEVVSSAEDWMWNLYCIINMCCVMF